jgi:alpha-ketoglutarate-dependent taurine dioxygenase
VPVESSPLADRLGFGAIVTGLERAELADPEIRQQLHDLWIDRGVVVFRGLPDDTGTQIELSELFGEPTGHPLRAVLGLDDDRSVEKLANIAADPDTGDIVVLADGRRLAAWLPWHFDLAYVERINHGGVLRALQLPEEGGETGFLDGIEAYQRLPADLRDEISSLNVVYRFDGDLGGLRYGATPGLVLERMSRGTQVLMDRIDRLPPVAHPLVYTQTETGRPVLNFSPWFALGIEGLEQEEADHILHRVAAVMIDERQAYVHQWQPGDMVLWDNWRILHCARGVPQGVDRHMQRTTIAGDYGHGRRVDWSMYDVPLT